MEENIKEMNDWKTKTLLIGAVVGALIGVTTAYLFTQKADDVTSRPQLTTGDGVKLGLLLLGLMRQVTELGDGNK